ncbi:helix-turn-helix domain-containing protein [Bacteroidota bacterium]
MWLRLFICGYIFVWIIQIHVLVIVDIWRLVVFDSIKIKFYFISAFVFVNLIVYTAFKTPEIFSKKYRKSSLDESDKKHFLTLLLDYMENEKPYLNPLLTLSGLSKKLLINRAHLSQIINETFQVHYHDFINKYRIQESQQIMSDPANRSINILEIAYKVGYNSKSVFNREFKKITGITPTEFRNNNHTR